MTRDMWITTLGIIVATVLVYALAYRTGAAERRAEERHRAYMDRDRGTP